MVDEISRLDLVQDRARLLFRRRNIALYSMCRQGPLQLNRQVEHKEDQDPTKPVTLFRDSYEEFR